MQNLFKRLMPLLSLSILIATGCLKEEEIRQRREIIPSPPGVPLNVDLVHVALHIEDKNMMPPAGDATLLWNNRGHTPIMAPDGHQVTFSEFNMVSGKAEVTCIYQGTNVDIRLQGLIPNGVYSIWVLTFKFPGFHGTFDNLIGNGALGPAFESNNIFYANSDGTASISANMPPGSLSLFGSAGNCLCSEYEIHLVAAYHSNSNNLIHPGSPGNLNLWVAQFVFPFRGSH